MFANIVVCFAHTLRKQKEGSIRLYKYFSICFCATIELMESNGPLLWIIAYDSSPLINCLYCWAAIFLSAEFPFKLVRFCGLPLFACNLLYLAQCLIISSAPPMSDNTTCCCSRDTHTHAVLSTTLPERTLKFVFGKWKKRIDIRNDKAALLRNWWSLFDGWWCLWAECNPLTPLVFYYRSFEG